MTKLYIGLKGEKQKEMLFSVCRDIFVKDKTFKFGIMRARYGDMDYLLIIQCEDKDHAFKRGCWFKGKVDDSILFWVKEER